MPRDIYGNSLPPIEESRDSDIFHNQITNKSYVFDNGVWNELPQDPSSGPTSSLFIHITNIESGDEPDQFYADTVEENAAFKVKEALLSDKCAYAVIKIETWGALQNIMIQVPFTSVTTEPNGAGDYEASGWTKFLGAEFNLSVVVHHNSAQPGGHNTVIAVTS